MTETQYYVFLRNDGYVGSISAENDIMARHYLRTYTPPSGKTVSFEILLATSSWDEARNLIFTTREEVAKEKLRDAYR